jgi:hypothetical protein
LTAIQICLFFIENDFHQAYTGEFHVHNETILNVFPGSSDQKRLVLVRCTTICGLEHLVLRQETHSADVGWFVQSCVAIEPGQVAGLKMTLSSATSQSTKIIRNGSNSETRPVILRFDQAS